MRTLGRPHGRRRERAQLSAVTEWLLGPRGDGGRREEPPRDESGFRALGSIQRFHRLLRHAVARARTTAPSLAGVNPAAEGFSFLTGDSASRPGRCRTNQGRYTNSTSGVFADLLRTAQPLRKTVHRAADQPRARRLCPVPVRTSDQAWLAEPDRRGCPGVRRCSRSSTRAVLDFFGCRHQPGRG